MTHIQRHLSANNRKDHQAQRIQDEEYFTQIGHDGGNNGGEYRSGRHDNDVFRVLYPAERIVAEKNVAYRAAANGRRGGNDNDAKCIHTATPSRKRTGHGFGSNTN